MSDSFFDLQATHNPHRYFLPVTRGIAVGPPDRLFLFGGVGLAAAIEAMERTTGRPVIWATAQYLSFARPGSIVDFDVRVPTEGRHSSQARVIGHIDDKEIITVNAALGARPMGSDGQWVAIPVVPPPLDCPEVTHWRGSLDDLKDRFEKRLAGGRYPTGAPMDGVSADGRMLLWVRAREGQPVGAAMLAVIADFVSEAIGNAIGRLSGGNSLDNTIRYASHEPTEWVLCDMRIEMVHAGVVHGAMHLFAESGALLATASQSLILRYHDEK
jgi:acyl-CoA thioesterase-2